MSGAPGHPAGDVGDELAALAHGLARHARRRRAMGIRRVEASPAPGDARAVAVEPSVPAPAVEPAPAPRPVAEPGTRAASAAQAAAAPQAASAPQAAQAAQAAPDPRAAPNTPPAAAAAGPPFERPAAPGDTPADLVRRAGACADLGALAHEVEYCQACELGSTRQRAVFADGLGQRKILFVGEAPGQEEDRQGRPFVGPAGQLLTDIITKGMGLDRARDVFICNVLKCRPPGNRDPRPDEKELCTAWLDRQIELVAPEVIVALGRHAAGHLLGTDQALGRLRGRVHERRGTPVVVTYHPAYLLRSPEHKGACWQDIQRAMQVVGLAPPARPGPG